MLVYNYYTSESECLNECQQLAKRTCPLRFYSTGAECLSFIGQPLNQTCQIYDSHEDCEVNLAQKCDMKAPILQMKPDTVIVRGELASYNPLELEVKM